MGWCCDTAWVVLPGVARSLMAAHNQESSPIFTLIFIDVDKKQIRYKRLSKILKIACLGTYLQTETSRFRRPFMLVSEDVQAQVGAI